uniref:Basement membrane proteoglycan n=1 Tax=Toxocara canis TaxID=6265 RepID=A0A183VBX4_TOXCA
LRCTIPARPHAQLLWRRQDGSMLSESAFQEEGTLTIPHVKPSDSGDYVCFSEDLDSGKTLESAPAHLTVNTAAPQTHKIPSLDTPTEAVAEGETATLRCHASADVNLELHWRRQDGSPLRHAVTDKGGTLTIPNAHQSDAGAYICYAEDLENGNRVDSERVYVSVNPPRASKPVPVVENGSQRVDEGTVVTFRCNVPFKDSGEVHWRREDGNAFSSETTDVDGILTISNVRLSDEGTYICYTEDVETGERTDSAPVHLNARLVAQAPEVPVVENPSESVEQGGTVTLRCNIPGKDVELHWRREDDSSVGYDISDGDGVLKISNVQQSDAGGYICYTEDAETGERVDSAPAYITVINPEAEPAHAQQTPIVENAAETVEEGATVEFRCSIPEEEGAELHWRRQDGSALSDEAKDVNGVLTVANVRLSDAGTYICYTENPENGTRVDSSPVHLTVNPSAPETEIKPVVDNTIVLIEEGGTVTFRCSLPGTDISELHWRREDGGFLPYEATDVDGVLSIPNVQTSDAGSYICYWEDAITGDRFDSTPATLKLRNNKFQSLKHQPLEQGETITLRCSMRAQPDALLQWRREDEHSMGWHVSQDGGVLTITDVQPADAGAYICSAEDPETGETVDSAPAYLTVNPSAPARGITPQIESPTESIEEGETVTLRCNLPDNGDAEMHWRREDGGSFGYDTTDQDGVLTIANIKQSDSGAYICSAEDRETGESVDSLPAYITVNPSTTSIAPIIDNPLETVNEGETVRFRCHVPGEDIAEVQWRRQDGSPLGYGVTEEEGTLVIAQAQSSDSGSYICSIENPRGGQIDSSPAYLTVRPGSRMFASTLSLVFGRDGNPMGYGVTDEDGLLTIPRVELAEAGAYLWTVEDPESGESVESAPHTSLLMLAHACFKSDVTPL